MPTADSHNDVVLIVEDDVEVLELIRRQLDRHSCQTAGVTSGAEALAWLDRRSAAIMLLDYSLADMQGDQLLRQLQQRNLETPFIVTTAHGSESVAVEMMRLGARDYVVKNAAFLELLPTVVERTLAQLSQERRLAEAQEQLRQAHDDLEQRVTHRTAELTAANARLQREIEERRRAKEQAAARQNELAHVARLSMAGEMVAELAHELNQPLAAISNYAQASSRVLRDAFADVDSPAVEDLASSLKQILTQANRAADIIRRPRRFVSKDVPARTTLDLSQLVRDVVSLVGHELRIEQIKTRLELAEPLPSVFGDRVQIEQVVLNLIRNAIEALRGCPRNARELTIETCAGGIDRVEVRVRDRGTGIPPEEMGKVFDRYYTTKPDGLGMGLSISRSIVDNHGGKLTAASVPQEGTTFTFYLPVGAVNRPRG